MGIFKQEFQNFNNTIISNYTLKINNIIFILLKKFCVFYKPVWHFVQTEQTVGIGQVSSF